MENCRNLEKSKDQIQQLAHTSSLSSCPPPSQAPQVHPHPPHSLTCHAYPPQYPSSPSHLTPHIINTHSSPTSPTSPASPTNPTHKPHDPSRASRFNIVSHPPRATYTLCSLHFSPSSLHPTHLAHLKSSRSLFIHLWYAYDLCVCMDQHATVRVTANITGHMFPDT